MALQGRLASTPEDEQVVWEVYAQTEKLIAVLKFRLDYETPGVFVTLPKRKDVASLVKEAEGLLAAAAAEVSDGRMVASIATMREARNRLRAYLTEKSRARSRTKPGATRP